MLAKLSSSRPTQKVPQKASPSALFQPSRLMQHGSPTVPSLWKERNNSSSISDRQPTALVPVPADTLACGMRTDPTRNWY